MPMRRNHVSFQREPGAEDPPAESAERGPSSVAVHAPHMLPQPGPVLKPLAAFGAGIEGRRRHREIVQTAAMAWRRWQNAVVNLHMVAQFAREHEHAAKVAHPLEGAGFCMLGRPVEFPAFEAIKPWRIRTQVARNIPQRTVVVGQRGRVCEEVVAVLAA